MQSDNIIFYGHSYLIIRYLNRFVLTFGVICSDILWTIKRGQKNRILLKDYDKTISYTFHCRNCSGLCRNCRLQFLGTETDCGTGSEMQQPVNEKFDQNVLIAKAQKLASKDYENRRTYFLRN